MSNRNVVSSMTGFARAEGAVDAYAWAVEIKSVNGRGLDVRCRLPGGLDALEPVARSLAAQHLKRGNVSITVTLNRTTEGGQIRINRALLAELIAVAREIEGMGAAPPRVDALLTVRGVIESGGDESDTPELRARLETAVSNGLAQAMEQLVEGRTGEGRHLAALLHGHVDEIERLTAAAAASAAAQPDALRTRLKAQLDEILETAAASLPEERLAQELALVVGRSDVREELDRLRAHADGARALLAEGGAIGRRLDFLCQEFNREANTLCSKSADVALTRIGLDLKAAIEQLREQVQNVE